MVDSSCKKYQNNHYSNRRNLLSFRSSKIFFCQLLLTLLLLLLVINTRSVTAEGHKKLYNSRSLHEILINENDGSIFSQTLLLHVAQTLNTIVQPHYKHRKLMISDYTNEGGSNAVFNTTAVSTSSTSQKSLLDGQDIPEIEQEYMNHICQIIQKSFTGTSSSTGTDTTATDNAVVCTCMGSIIGTLTINCDYSTSVCSYSNATSNTVVATTTATTRSSIDTTTSTGTNTIQTCGKPQLGVTMVRGNVFSATTCISSYERNLQSIPDTCVFVNSCSMNTESNNNLLDVYDDIESTDTIVQQQQQQNTNTNSFCECTASYNGTICKTCEICSDGQSMNIDCTTPINPNGFKTSSTCQSIDLDLDLSNNAGSIAGFNPFFGTSMNTTTNMNNTSDNFCSQLEVILNNTVTCDCTSLSTATTATTTATSDYTISCTTIDEKCSPTSPTDSNLLCGTVTSFMHIRNGQIVTTSTDSNDNDNSTTGSTSTSTITSCVKYKEPFDETCTTFNYCSDTEEQVLQPGQQVQQQSSNEKLCSCTATYNGQNCTSCNVCNNGLGVQLDCSNIYYEALTNECQLISRLDTNYEFVPAYTTTRTHTQSSNNKKNQQQQSSGSVLVPISIPSKLIIAILHGTLLFGLVL